ncbi:UNVERIFIED_CONTAM: hypothetical protein GTU68_042611 [Idotea baltica]|nr:hypothetical protein [Idotea baltica]
MNDTALEVHNLNVSYDSKPVLWAIDFKIPKSSLACIVGPNGAGKSTLLKSIMNLIEISSGEVKFFDEKLDQKRSLIAYVPQREEVDWNFPISVYEVVMMGRYGRNSFLKKKNKDDDKIVEESLKELDVYDLKDRQISQLSGGQQQRVFLARALAQNASIYLMDEPFAGIDASTEKKIVKIFKKLKSEGKTIICVHHDLNTVPEYFDWTIFLNLRLIASGLTKDVFTSENLTSAYGPALGLLTQVAEKFRNQKWHRDE